MLPLVVPPSVQALMAEGAGDHILLLRCWDAWEGAGCSKEAARQLGLDLRGMGWVRDIRRQLEGERWSGLASAGHPTPALCCNGLSC
jgi:hypothetical protein